jgi:WD40 repeat protein
MRRACVAVAERDASSARVAVSLSGGHVLLADVGGPHDSSASPAAAAVQHVAGEDGSGVLSLALSPGGSLLAIGAEDKKVRVCDVSTSGPAKVLGHREVMKKPTALLFAQAAGKVVLLASDKFGDVWASPLPDISTAVQHLLGHTGTCVTSMAMAR